MAISGRFEPMAFRCVRRAEDFYTPPPQMRSDAWDGIPPAERVIAFMERVTQRQIPRPEAVLPDFVLIARVDAGRWVAQCPICASAQVVSPDDPRMWCVDCQPDGWFEVRFPDAPAAIEEEMAKEPLGDRFWWADDDTAAWNKPPPPPLLTPKQQRAIEERDTIPPPPPDTPAVEEPPVAEEV